MRRILKDIDIAKLKFEDGGFGSGIGVEWEGSGEGDADDEVVTVDVVEVVDVEVESSWQSQIGQVISLWTSISHPFVSHGILHKELFVGR